MQMQAYHPQNPTTLTPPPLSHVNYAADGDKTSGVGFMRRFLPGYRFQPTDKEIILEYLMKKINNEALPSNMINTAGLYSFSPDDLTQRFRASGDREWYFFTRRERKFRNGHVVDRVAGDGYWRATAAPKHIMHNGERIGSRRPLAYFMWKLQDSVKTDWLMQEFRAMSSSIAQENSMRLDDWVVCKVYKTSRKSGYRMTDDVVSEIGTSRKRYHNGEVKDGEVNNNKAYTEAIQLSVDSSIAIASPSSSSSFINGSPLANLNNPQGLGSAPTQNIEGNDNRASDAAKHLHVESSRQLSTARSDAICRLPLPAYIQQFPNFASESRYRRPEYHTQLEVQQGHDQLNVEHQALPQLHVEYPSPLSGPSSSSSSHDASPLPLPCDHQQGSSPISGEGTAPY